MVGWSLCDDLLFLWDSFGFSSLGFLTLAFHDFISYYRRNSNYHGQSAVCEALFSLSSGRSLLAGLVISTPDNTTSISEREADMMLAGN